LGAETDHVSMECSHELPGPPRLSPTFRTLAIVRSPRVHSSAHIKALT